MVLNGMIANQTTFNTAFVSRTAAATSTAAIVSLINTAIASGASVNNVQALLNKLIEGIGTTGELDTAINDYASNNYVADGESRKEAIEALDVQLFSTQSDLEAAEAAIVIAQAYIATLLSDVNTINNLPSTFAGDKVFTDDVTVNGNMTVNGTTTTFNSTTVDSVDPNVTINKTGNDATSEGAGFTVDRTGTKGSLIYGTALTSKWALGELGSEAEVATVSHTQTFTNKTLTSPIVNGGTLNTVSLVTPNVDIITSTEQGATPATPAAGKRKLYPKADGFYQLDSTGLETKVGSGSGSGGATNLITDGDAEQGFASYVEGSYAAAARPSGTFTASAGTGALAISTTTTNPINTTKSFLITKSAGASRQGRAVERTIVLDREYQTKVLNMRIKFSVVSGTFVAGSSSTDSSMIWYIGEFNGTTWTYTEPSSFKALSNGTLVDYVDGTFQVKSDTTQIKLISYVAETANSAWALMCEYEISPSTYAQGTPSTNMVTHGVLNITSTGTSPTKGATSVDRLQYKRIADAYYYEMQYAHSTAGAAGTGEYLLNLPFSIDLVKHPIGTKIGTLNITAVPSVNYSFVGYFLVFSATQLKMAAMYNNSANAQSVYTNIQSVFGEFSLANYSLSGSVLLSSAGLESVTRMSDGYEGRSINFMGYVSTNQILAATVTNLPLTARRDNTGSWSGSTFIVPSAGDYLAGAFLTYTTASSADLAIYKNGVIFKRLCAGVTYSAGQFAIGNSTLEDLKAGDVLSIRSANFGVTVAADASGFVSITKILGPQTISAGSKEVVAAVNNSGQSFTSLTTLTGWTVEQNTHGLFNPTTGVWTCTQAGPVSLSAMITMSTPTSGDVQVDIWKNAAMVRQYLRPFHVAGSNLHTATLVYETSCIAGDTLYLRAAASSATALSANNRCSLNITRG
jgi:hypothetical protein